MGSLDVWLKTCLKNIKHKKFEDAVSVEVNVQPMGDGQVVIISDINRAILTLKTANDKEIVLKAIAKVALSEGPGKELADEYGLFDTEIMMYNEILKPMGKLMSEVGHDDYLWPDSYYCAGNKLLLEDLCEAGYRLVPTYQFLDYEHALLALKAIGKFHAMSLVMMEKNLLDKTKLKPSFYSQRSQFIINVQKMYIGKIAKIMEESWKPDGVEIAKKLNNLVEEAGDSMCDMCDSVAGLWFVMNHGDFSIRNMLFHYAPDSSIPDGIKLVDFQACNYSCCGFDLGSFLYSSLMPKVRDDNMDKLLDGYVDSMKSTCDKYNYSGKLPVVEDIKNCLKLLSYLTSTTSLCSIPFFIASGKHDVQKRADEMVDTCGAGELTSQEATKEKDVLFNDEEIIEVMKYEIKRMIEENIL